jgi:hypothetical protein
LIPDHKRKAASLLEATFNGRNKIVKIKPAAR